MNSNLRNSIFIVAIAVLLFNLAFFNTIFNSVGLVAWKQFTAVAMFVSTALYFIYKAPKFFRNLYAIILLSLIISLVVVFFNNLNNGYGWINETLMMGYKFSGYGVFFGIIYLLLEIKDKVYIEKINKVIYCLCLLIAIGVIIDFYTSIFDTYRFVKENAYASNVNLSNPYNKRVSFFVGSSSLLYFIFSLPLFTRFIGKEKIDIRTFDFFYILICFSAIYLSGSRLSLVCFSFVFIFLFFMGIKKDKRSVKFLKLLLVLFLCSFFILEFKSFNAIERILNMFSQTDPGNVGRLFYYKWFVSNINTFSFSEVFFGYGYGFLNSYQNTFPSIHFESSLISLIIENGFFGLFLMIFLFMLILQISRMGMYLLFLFLFCVNFLFVPCFLNYIVMFILAYVVTINYKITRGCCSNA